MVDQISTYRYQPTNFEGFLIIIGLFLALYLLHKLIDWNYVKIYIDGQTYKVHKDLKPDEVISRYEYMPDGESFRYSVDAETQKLIHEKLAEWKLKNAKTK